MTTVTDFTQRDQLLHTWLQQVFADQPFQHQRLAGDASFRSYHRLTVGQHDKTINYIVMDAPPEKESIDEFITVANLMKDFVHVPELIAINQPQGFIVLEDLGSTDFADVIGHDDLQATNHYYQQAMQTIIELQKISLTDAEQAKLPHYNKELLQREMNLFTEWFLPYVNTNVSTEKQQLWQQLQNDMIEKITQQYQVVVHRDFHSRNLMITNHGLGVIDFQDAVIGAYSYDAISLLRDAYVDWSESQTDKWLQDFYQLSIKTQPNLTFDQFQQDCMVMGLQRHLKILGIFVRLYQRDGKNRYLANLPRVMNDTLIEAKWLAEHQAGIYQDFYQWLIHDIQPNFVELNK